MYLTIHYSNVELSSSVLYVTFSAAVSVHIFFVSPRKFVFKYAYFVSELRQIGIIRDSNIMY